MPPSISVIVPVCNTAPWLERCLQSLLAQTQPDMEIILVDDASTDDSPAICAHYAAEYPDVVRLFSLPRRQGPGAARNRGMVEAQGGFIGFVDSDDSVTPRMYETMYTIAVRERADIVVCGFERTAPSGSVRILPQKAGEINAAALLTQRKIQPSSCNKIVRQTFLDTTGARFPESYCAEDMAFCFIMLTENPVIYSVQEPLYIYHQRNSSLTVDIMQRKWALESLYYCKNIYKTKKNLIYIKKTICIYFSFMPFTIPYIYSSSIPCSEETTACTI